MQLALAHCALALQHRGLPPVQLAQLDAAQMPTEAAAVHENAKALSALLERHLSDEEEIVVPILLHHKMRG